MTPPQPAATTNPANEPLVKGLGLFSATSIVIGSMIGSGIFIVSADIGRVTGSPALLIGAWLVTAVMTIIGALSYGELAAMMPKAGGQYVYLREALGPMWGFLFGWTLFLVIQTGTIAAVGVAFGKFLGVFFPSVSSTHWLLRLGHIPAVRLGPVTLGNMELGINTANLAGVLIVLLLTIVNIFGVRLGALVQNIFTTAKTLALLAPCSIWHNARSQPRRDRRQFRARSFLERGWAAYASPTRHRRRCCAGWPRHHAGRRPDRFTLLRRRLE